MEIVREYSNTSKLDAEENLLPVPSSTCTESNIFENRRHKKWWRITWPQVYVTALHVVAAASLLLLIRKNAESSISNLTREQSWSPIQRFIEYEISQRHAVNHEQYSKYSGPPTTAQDRAWDELMKPVYFKATLEELQTAGESMENKVQLADGGFLSSLGVYHELHCLRQLRLLLYRDRYYNNITEAQEHYLQSHLDHCIETLRLTIMCHGNIGVYSFAWNNPKAAKPETQSNSKSVCTKWVSIETWALSRMTSPDPLLLRPEN